MRTLLGDITQLFDNIPGHRVGSLGFNVQIKNAVEIADGHDAFDHHFRIVDHGIVRVILIIILILYIAHDLRDQVIEGHHAQHAAELINDDGHMLL